MPRLLRVLGRYFDALLEMCGFNFLSCRALDDLPPEVPSLLDLYGGASPRSLDAWLGAPGSWRPDNILIVGGVSMICNPTDMDDIDGMLPVGGKANVKWLRKMIRTLLDTGLRLRAQRHWRSTKDSFVKRIENNERVRSEMQCSSNGKLHLAIRGQRLRNLCTQPAYLAIK